MDGMAALGDWLGVSVCFFRSLGLLWGAAIRNWRNRGGELNENCVEWNGMGDMSEKDQLLNTGPTSCIADCMGFQFGHEK